MANKLELKLYDGNDLIEDSQLRSVLLFYQFSSKHEGEEFMMQRLVLSIIIQENGNCSLDDIQRALAAKSITLSAKEVNKYLTALISDKLIFALGESLGKTGGLGVHVSLELLVDRIVSLKVVFTLGGFFQLVLVDVGQNGHRIVT